jgi:hypothetical protein
MRSFVQCNEKDAPVLFESESILYELSEVELAFETSEAIGRGSLYVTTTRFVWIGRELAFDFDVPFVVLHSITRDPNSYKTPCLYCQLDQFSDDDWEGGQEDSNDDEDEDEDGAKTEELLVKNGCTEGIVAGVSGAVIRNEERKGGGERDTMFVTTSAVNTRTGEMYLSPLDESHLTALYEAFSRAALLNPDPLEEGHEEGEDDELIYDVAEVALGAEQARALAHLESVFVSPQAQTAGNEEEDLGCEGEDDYYEEEDEEGRFDDAEN